MGLSTSRTFLVWAILVVPLKKSQGHHDSPLDGDGVDDLQHVDHDRVPVRKDLSQGPGSKDVPQGGSC